ncbi:MAG TPA: Asp-tRNA(Asn)/Glu-tRNA(Gln) amidotransferase subunit GatA [Clostridia bacterium]|nr:Asp-tRNA(Asn)/Glu-tRNA(Gln) amidotransferase subunit GatA [Clostridia bacterium]
MELHELAISELSALIRNREICVPELTRHLLDRIEKLEPKLHCYITVTPEKAMEKARRVQAGIDAGTLSSPLAGIPMAYKDNICTRGVLTTCGSRMLGNFVPPYDASVVHRLDRHGVVPLGKLNMDEFAMGSSTETSYYHQTRNPWDVERVPGGSSGGSAAAVTAGEAVFTLGSDTGGSIRQPASFCGCVGLKPTYGLVSRFGLVAYASSLDQIGPLAKTVRDCALVLNAIAGRDPLDQTTVDVPRQDYTQALTGEIKGLVIGLPRQFVDESVAADVREAVLAAAKVFTDLGAECREIDLPIMEYVVPTYYIIALAEASSNLARYDGVKFGYRVPDPKDMIDFCKRSRSEGFGSEVKKRILLGTYVLSSGYYDAYYKKALQARVLITRAFNKAFEECDVLMGPVAPTTAYKIGEKINDPLTMYMEDIFTVPVNLARLPGISLPCGFDRNHLPIGLQLIGKPFGEATILNAAYAFEQNTGFHKQRPNLKGR